MFPILINLGPLTLHTYGLMVAIGFLAGLHVARIQFESMNLPLGLLDRIVFCLMVFGLLGARIFYFGVDNFSELKSDPLSFLRIWEGGLVFYGGVIGGLLTLIYFSQKEHIPFLALTDVFAAPLLLAHAIGRLGCFAAGCCYGKETSLPWAVIFKDPASLAPRFVPLHPTQLYESLGNVLLFLGIFLLGKRKHRIGLLSSTYLVSYGVFRFLIEFLRGDDRGLAHFGASPSQLVAAMMILAGIGIWSFAPHDNR